MTDFRAEGDWRRNFAWDAFLAESRIPPDHGQWRTPCHRGGENRLRAAGEDFRRHAGLDLARLSDGALSACIRRLSAQAVRRSAISPSTARCWAARPSSSTARRGACICRRLLGEALGKLYVARYFPPEAKAKADALVSNLLKAYEADIQTLTWMSPETKAKALEKIAPIHAQDRLSRPIGAIIPPMIVKRDDLVGDIQRAGLFEWNREVARINQPVDKTEWGMTPPTINAYYNPSFNEIVFPGRHPAAALLRSQGGRCGELWRHRRGDRA